MDKNTRTLVPHLSPLNTWALSIGTSIGWGSLVVTANTYLAKSGPMGTVLGLVAGALIMLFIGQAYAYLMQCYPESGGAYAYAREVLGYDHGFLTAWFLALTYLAVFWANATSLPLFARYFLGDVFRIGRLYTIFGYEVYLGEALLTVAAILIMSFVCARLRRGSELLLTVLAILFTAGITVVFLGAVLKLDRPLSPAYVPDSGALSQIIRIAVISPWAFIGFENISHTTEEFSFRHSRIFPILVLSVISTLVLYIFIVLLSVTAYPPQYDSWLSYIRDLGNLNGIEALPAFYAANHYLGSFGTGLLMLSLLALIITSLIGNTMALCRLFYALGKDKLLPSAIGRLNDQAIPENAVFLVAGLSLAVPFLGRTAIGWIVDVTTIGATIVYGFVSACAYKVASLREDKVVKRGSLLGLLFMIAFLLYLLLPNLISTGSMEKESYFLFIIWSVLGFLFFRSILRTDKARRFGKSIIVWVALLALVLFVAIIWMRQSMISSNAQMLSNIHAYYAQTPDHSDLRLADELFIQQEVQHLEHNDTRTILMATGMFLFSLVIMLTNYSYMNKRTKESETIANTDPMTGVKSKHAFLMRERGLNAEIEEGIAREFSIVVCDVNGLKHINDTYGHKAGDDYIRAASTMICELFQHSPVFRVGGDEFCVVLSGRDYEKRMDIMNELHRLSESHIGSDKVVVSAGLSDYIPGQDHSMHTVFERADALMYEKKQALKQMGARTR